VALEELHVGIHTAGGGGAEGTGGIAFGGLGGTGVVDGVIFDVLRQLLAGIEKLKEFMKEFAEDNPRFGDIEMEDMGFGI
jgi:hypothetical protein